MQLGVLANLVTTVVLNLRPDRCKFGVVTANLSTTDVSVSSLETRADNHDTSLSALEGRIDGHDTSFANFD